MVGALGHSLLLLSPFNGRPPAPTQQPTTKQVALLDMLANGTNPRKIIPYLSDCFDALAGLRFVQVRRVWVCLCMHVDERMGARAYNPPSPKTDTPWRCITIVLLQEEDGKESSRTVDMMVAKDRERVPLHAPFTMEGACACIHMHPSAHLLTLSTNEPLKRDRGGGTLPEPAHRRRG